MRNRCQDLAGTLPVRCRWHVGDVRSRNDVFVIPLVVMEVIDDRNVRPTTASDVPNGRRCTIFDAPSRDILCDRDETTGAVNDESFVRCWHRMISVVTKKHRRRINDERLSATSMSTVTLLAVTTTLYPGIQS